MSYKIVSAMKTKERDSDYGVMIDYAAMFEGETEAVEISQKQSTPAPKAGDTLEGTINPTKWGRKFKKAQAAFSGGQKGSYDTEGMRWGNSMNVAVQLVAAYRATIKQELAADKVLEYAKYFFDNGYKKEEPNTESKPEVTTTPQGDDEPPIEDREPF